MNRACARTYFRFVAAHAAGMAFCLSAGIARGDSGGHAETPESVRAIWVMDTRVALYPRYDGVHAAEAPRVNPLAGSETADALTRRQVLTLDATTAPAADASDANELAKKLSNPVANLISVPFQYNIDFNGGTTGHATRSYLNIQPVIPIQLNKDWNLITRTIVPVVYQEELVPGQSTNFGLGDTTASFFFSPREPVGGWIVGVGPIFLLPTGTDTALGGGKWGAGPTAVVLQQEHGWTYGMLASHTWSFAGDGDRNAVNLTFLQPFLTYTFPTATTVGVNTESTYDWTNRQWTMPVNIFASQVVKIGGAPVNFQVGGRYYAEGPSGGPEWGLRFVVTLLFPK